MPRYVIIFSTGINTSIELQQVTRIVATFKSIIEWNIDLTDEDRILRIIAFEDISKPMIRELQKAGVGAVLMGVFQ